MIYKKKLEQESNFYFKMKTKKKDLAFLEFKVSKLREELANIIYDTMNLVRKKQTRGY
jgi:hypothetical protein